jgi:hydrogenase 3 maturation protease
MSAKIETSLHEWLSDSKRVVVAGIGNPERSDDNVGPKIVQRLKGQVRCGVLLLECETVPESYLLDIERYQPTHVLLIDAAKIGLKPGDSRLMDAAGLASFSPVSSHALPLRVFCDYLKKAVNPKIALLLVEPQSLEYSEGLTPKVEAASQRLASVLNRLLR